MYVITRERLGLIPPPFGFFVLPPAIQAFLDDVRKNPKSSEPLLLTVELHPDPLYSDLGPGSGLRDLILMNTLPRSNAAVGKMVLGALKTIFNQHKQDPQFQRQVEAEKKLANQLQQTTGKVSRQKLEPFLFNAWLEPDVNLTGVGRSLLPTLRQAIGESKLRQAISQSKVPNTQLFNLGRFLRQLAETLQRADGAFTVRAELELRNRMLTLLRNDMVLRTNELKPLLAEAALASEASLWQIGASLAKRRISHIAPRLLQLTNESAFKMDHFSALGKALKAHASKQKRKP